ncbi:MAG: hypothetical protein WCP82_12210 [Alphaproteobacteria bacterium]
MKKQYETGTRMRFMLTGGVAVGLAVSISLAAASTSWAQDDDGELAPLGVAVKTIDVKKVNMYYADPSKPNIGGFWRPEPGPRVYWAHMDGTRLPARGASGQDGFPYRPDWQAAYQARRDAEVSHHPYGDPAAACWPQGMFKAYIGTNGPIEITQTPGRVLLQHERLSETRRIHTDGRKHPVGEGLQYTAEGDSIGHWEGKTLVVDTVGTRREFTLSMAPGMPHSEAAHFTERFTRVDPVTLRIDIKIDDPKAMTEPMQTSLIYKLFDHDHMDEDFCVENNRNRPDENLRVQVDLTPHKRYGFDLPE